MITEAEPSEIPRYKIIYVNDAFVKMSGYEADDVIGKTPAILQGANSNKEDLEQLNHALQNWESHETTIINYKKNGEEFWINFKVSPVANESGRYTHWIAVERDVTDKKNRELEKDLISNINSIFNQSDDNDIAICLTKLCREITEFGGFDFSELWLPAIDDKRINLVANYSKSDAGSAFYNATKTFNSFDLGEELSGHVWKNKTIEIWENTEGRWVSKRKVAAAKTGIQCMMGVPLQHKEDIIGVLLMGTNKKRPFLNKYSEIFERIEVTISAELSRKKMEIELAQIFDFTPDMICVAGFDGFIKRMNPAGLEILGYSLDEMCSKPITSFMHQEDRLITKKKQKELYKGRKVESFENRYLTKTGQIVWLSWTATSAPEYGIVYAAAKNITEEKNLRELNRQVGQLAKIGSWEVDVVNETVFWSDEVHKIYGTDPRSFVPDVDTAINFYREDYRQLALSSFETCLLTQEPYTIEAVIVTSDKKELWVRTTAKADYMDGVCTRVYGSFQDISAIKDTENRLLSLSENLPGVVYQYLINPNGTDELRYVSKGAEKTSGFTAKEWTNNINLLFNQIEAGGNMEEFKSSIRKSIETKSKWTCRYKYVMPTGEVRTHMGFGTPNFLTDGTVLFNNIALDITQEAKNEELLEQITKVARIGSWELDLVNKEGDEMYWSPMLFDILELDDSYKPTLTGGIEFHVGESKDRIEKALQLLINEGIEFDEEILVRTATGKERWNRAIGKCETANQKVTRIYGSYQDIHNRKESELELIKAKEKAEESDAKFKSYSEQSPVGIYTTNIEGDFIYANETWLQMAGMQLKDALGAGWINALHPDDIEYVKTNWYKSVKSKGKWTYEYRFIDKKQKITWISGTAKELHNDKNELIGYLGSNVDITERKKAEQEKNNLQVTIENSLNEIYIFDANTLLFTYVNKGAYLNLGYSEEEMKTLTPIDIKPDYTPDTFNHLVAPLILKEKEKILFFTNHLRKDGSMYPVEVHLQLFDEGDNKRFLAIILDITERKKAEEKILQANERFEKVTEATNDAIWDWDIENDTFYRSEAIEHFFGRKTLKSLSKLDFWKDNFHPEDKETIIASIDAALADPKYERWEQEYRIINPEGAIVYVIDQGIIVRDLNGKAIRMVGAMTDISKQKKSDRDNRFKANLLSTIGQAAIATDLDGTVNYWNHAAESIYGWTAEEAIGKNIINLTPSQTNEKEAKQIMDLLQKGQTWSGEFQVKKKDGSNFHVSITNSPIYDEKNTVSGIIGISSDITQEVKNKELLEKYTRELERSNEDLEQFAFVTSHDLQEPLRMISSFMDLLSRKYNDQLDEKAHQYIHFATDGAKRMKQIILDLLDYSRAGDPKERKEVVDLNEVVDDFKHLRRKLILEKSASITTNDLPKITNYKAAITQICHCLLDNALKYSKEDIAPIVEVTAVEKENEWLFSIKDNGIGIDAQFFDKIFVIFQRLHNKDTYEGTGIGLSIAKRHVELLGGKIWVESHLGEGTLFHFTIPK